MGFLLVGQAHQSTSGGAYKDVTVLPLQQAGDIAGHVASLQVVCLDIVETFAVVGLKSSIHTYIK